MRFSNSPANNHGKRMHKNVLNKQKIAFVISYICKNGPSRVVLGIIMNLDQRYYSVSLITLFSGNDPSLVEDLRKRNIFVHECNTLSKFGCICNKTKEFKDIVEKGDYDIIHTHGMIPDIISARLACRAKRISTIHNNMFEDYLHSYGRIMSSIYTFWHLNSLRKLDQCICCSSTVYDVMKNKIEHISCVRNGIDFIQDNSPSSLRDTLDIPTDSLVFLFAGTLNEGKNIVWLIQEFLNNHKENDYLIVLGTGEKEKECNRLANDHVKVLGYKKNVSDYMKIADIYVSASKSEGFSIAVIEALSFGMGLFLSDIPSHKEVLEIQKTIYLGDLFNQSNFKEKYEQIRKRTFEKKAIIGFQEKELSAKRMTNEITCLYAAVQKNIRPF